MTSTGRLYYPETELTDIAERARLSSFLVLLLSGCFCFSASFLSRWLPGSDGRFTSSRRENKPTGLLGPSPEDANSKGWHAHLPERPRKFSLPLLILCIVVRSEVFYRIYSVQQCSTPGIEVRCPHLPQPGAND